ncbi:MAG: hypothetical protein V3R37_10490 [Rhodospirillales bacterium]
MAMIIGSLALVIALMETWLATNSMKNVAIQGDLLLQRIRKEQKDALSEVAVKIKTLETSNRKLTEMIERPAEEKS